jgi:hypothetical protein
VLLQRVNFCTVDWSPVHSQPGLTPLITIDQLQRSINRHLAQPITRCLSLPHSKVLREAPPQVTAPEPSHLRANAPVPFIMYSGPRSGVPWGTIARVYALGPAIVPCARMPVYAARRR